MNARTIVRNVAVALVVLAFGGAGMGAVSANAQTSSRAPHQVSHANQVGHAKYEKWLSKQVRDKLLSLPWVGVFDNLEYKINGRKVTLTGQVVEPVSKFNAENSVKRIRGVSKVVNKIKVLPLSGFDNQIRRAEYLTIFSQPSLTRYAMGANPSVHIIVDNGHVTLKGYVSNKMDRTLVGMRARSVPDVFSVTNDLHIA